VAITLTSQLTDVVLDPGSPTALGTGNAQASETVIQLQGANCAAIGHSGSVGPTSGPTIANLRGMTDAGNNVTRSGTHLHIWVRDLYPVRNVDVGGLSIYLLGTSAALYHVTGLDKGYAGGWYHSILNLDPTTRPAASVGTAPSSNITSIGYEGNISASKGESFLQNCYFDAIRSGTAGQGVTFTGGTSGAPETFASCVTADATTYYGMLRNIGGALFIEGPITWGAATLTTWIAESLQTLTFTNFTVNNGTSGLTVVPAVASDYYRIVLADATTGVTNINFSDVTFKGVSRAEPFSFTSNLGTGDAYVSLRTTYLFASTVTLNTLCTSTGDKFIECVTIVPGGITLTSPAFSNCDAVTLTATNDKISGGTVSKHNTTAGNPFITTNDLAKVENTAFDNTGGVGHAILINTAGTYTFTGNTCTGYGADASTSAAIYNNSGGLVTINVAGGGGTPTYRNGTSASTVINAGSVSATVTCKTTAAAAIQNARVFVKASDGTGPFPYQASVTISNSGTTATVTHATHGMLSGDKVLIDGASHWQNNGVFTITYISAGSYSYTLPSAPGSSPTGTIVATFVALEGLTDASGQITMSRVFASAQPITGWARKGSASPFYKTGLITGSVSASAGFSTTVVMVSDE